MEVEQCQHEEKKAREIAQPSDDQTTSFRSSSLCLETGIASNGNLTFTKSKIRSDEERLLILRGNRNSLRISLLLTVLLLSTIGAILLAVFWTSHHEAPFDYAMVFDAGSTHTEMVIYKWQANKYRGTGVVSQVTSCDMPGGIGKVLRQNPGAEASAYLAHCVQTGLASIPEDRRSHSPLFLAATAGMRLVRSESPDRASQIMGNVSRALDMSAKGMLQGVNSVRIISGQEEGVAGWISANYLLRTIYPEPTKLVGMLDMGGASTQITFVRGTNVNGTSSTFDTTLQLYGARHELYSRSYMCFGQNQMLNRYYVLLIKDFLDSQGSRPSFNAKIRVPSPCHHTGWNSTVSFDDYVNVCSATTFTDELRDITVTVEGSSDPTQCKSRTSTLLNPGHCDRTFNSKDCFGDPAPHSEDTSFVAVSGFYYLMQALGFENNVPSITDYLAAVNRWCKSNWNDLKATNRGTVDEYLSQDCFRAQYQGQILLDRYGIKDNTWKNIKFRKKVNGTSVGWTLGFTIRSTNAFPEEEPMEPFPAATFTALMFALAVCVGVFLTLAVRIILKTYCKSNQVSVK